MTIAPDLLFEATYNHRWALLIGVDDYGDPGISKLKVCSGDVQAIYGLLTANDYKPDHIRLLLSPGESTQLPTRAEILSALTSIAQTAGEDDFLLFYFSGHGISKDGEAFLLPSDTRYTALADTAISLSRVKKIIQDSSARAKVIILDACHSGAKIGKNSLGMTEEFIHHVFSEAEGLVILSSCKQQQVSWEWSEKGQSVFTHYLLQGLQGEADFQRKGFVTVSDINQYVTDKVKSWAVKRGHVQIPTLQCSTAGEIVLAKYQVPTVVVTSQTLTLRQAWLRQMGFVMGPMDVVLDPFLYTDGGNDPYLSEYFYQVGYYVDILGDTSRPQASLVFGSDGSGKSSLRNSIAKTCSEDHGLPILYRDFGRLVAEYEETGSIKILAHVRQILRIALRTLADNRDIRTKSLALQNDTQVMRNYLWLYVKEYEDDPERRQILSDLLSPSADADGALPRDYCEHLARFFRYVAKILNYTCFYVLVDPDFDIHPDINTAWAILEPLLESHHLMEIQDDKIAFKFFLNEQFMDNALRIRWINHRQHSKVFRLEWSLDKFPQRLPQLLQERLIRSSNGKYTSLEQLVEPEVKDVEGRLIRASEEKPRDMIALCSRLVSLHCQSDSALENPLITSEEVEEILIVPETERLIAQGESMHLEFKSTMRYSIKDKKRDKELDKVIAKTLCGFMNAEGGTLVIGVDDNGNALGLDADIATLQKKNEDGFQLAFTDLVSEYIGLPACTFVNLQFVDYQGRRICVIRVTKNCTPVFFQSDQGTEFYMRAGNSTRRLDSKEMLDYIQARSQNTGDGIRYDSGHR